jgi:hypothetical protein
MISPGGTRGLGSAGGRDGDGTVSPWRGTKPELVIAGVLVAAAAVAGYVMAGWDGLSVVVIVAGAIALLVLRALLPQLTPDQAKKAREKPTARTLSGYSHRRFVVRTASDNLAFYNADRHGVNLYQDPAAARGLLCRSPRDAGLWAWIDPVARPKESARGHSEQPGIPRRTLARLIDRLEQL